MFFKTVQASAFKTIFEVLKDVLNDVNIIFDKDGMKILTLDTARAALIDLSLLSENFEEYSCTEEVTAGVNMANMFKLLKTIGNNDTLEVRLDNNEFMDIFIQNTDKKSKTSFKLKLLDINEDRIDIPKVDIEVITVMTSMDFQRICRDMGNLSNDVSISRSGTELKIACEGDFANQETVIECGDDSASNTHGKYSLKYLNIFTKATSMCSNMRILQNTESNFLILSYNVANLGYLQFYLASKVSDEE